MASLPLTPSHSPQGSLDPDSPQPRNFHTGHKIPRLDGHCVELADLMGGDESHVVDDDHSREKEDTNPGHAEHTSYRHGQIGVYKPFPRFDQASRPIVSDNWRAAAAASLAGKSQTQTSNDNKLSLAAPSLASTTTLFSPARSPLTAPIDSSIAGFAFNPKPPHSTPGTTLANTQREEEEGAPLRDPTSPPTPVSLTASVSTPISGRGVRFDLGSGHVHRTSLSSVDTAASSDSQTQATQLQTTQTRPTTNANKQPVTFTVTITPDTLGYSFARPDGTRTRLVPVDMLPFALEGIPARERESDGLVELPIPEGVGKDGRSSNWQVLSAVTPPGANSGDVIQSLIDRILAAPSSPPSSTHHHQTTLTTTQTATAATTTPPSTAITTLSTIPTSTPIRTTPTSTSSFTPSSKRMKVYCDKWVHEGVCAFTQQGCKYKHEMPADRATQHQLGLFLGYPAWWKRRQGELARVQTQTAQGQTQQTQGGQGQIQGQSRGLGLGLNSQNTGSQNLGLGMPMGMGMGIGMGGTQTRGQQIQGYGPDGRGWRMLPPAGSRTQTQPQPQPHRPRLLTAPGDDLDTSEPRDFRSGPASHGLAASRWGGGGGGNLGNMPVDLPPAREKILPAAWRSQVPSSASSSPSSVSGGKATTNAATGSSSSSHDYDGPIIPSYDGASDGVQLQHRQQQYQQKQQQQYHDELSRYRLSSSDPERGAGLSSSSSSSLLLLSEVNNRNANSHVNHQLGNNTSSSGFSGNDTRPWAWEDQNHQQQQQTPYRAHGQTLSGSGSTFAAACSFSFRPTTTTTTTTPTTTTNTNPSPTHPTHAKPSSNTTTTTTEPQSSTPPSPSPFGPIAPPGRRLG
ncbi:hypothetical protein B0J18DRAFT_408240 [Chaetomium sp. MPI-SDFR-AT-0129]|nr:hypothetical protein B0J18DRAFT_408240 [Chaetomium sp. MPI-SDFR-AT-0129]